MYRKLARVIGSVAAAALLAVSMSACGGGDAPKDPKKEAPKTEEPKPAEGDKKESDAKGATEVAYKCAKEGCPKTKSAAAGAAAPQC